MWTIVTASATGDGLHQLQVRLGQITSLKLGRKTITLENRKSGLQFIPLHLAPGAKYRLLVTGTTKGKRLPDIRFGPTGPRSLNPANCLYKP